MSENKNGGRTRTTLRHCSFCGKSEKEVYFLIPSKTGAFLCNECIDLCNSVIDMHTSSGSATRVMNIDDLPKPEEIKKTLDEYVIGQDDAKSP